MSHGLDAPGPPLRQALDLLAPVYDWFTEGFGMKDLKDAKGLLEELKIVSPEWCTRKWNSWSLRIVCGLPQLCFYGPLHLGSGPTNPHCPTVPKSGDLRVFIDWMHPFANVVSLGQVAGREGRNPNRRTRAPMRAGLIRILSGENGCPP